MQWLGLWGAYAPVYLKVLVIGTTLAFALPIFLVPLHWARAMQWRIPEHTDLAVYFGRCLGAFILIFEWLAWRAAHGHDIEVVFRMLLAITGSMVLVHIYGALRRIQPWTETLEIGFYAGLFALSVLFYPLAT
ncbi:hypothetical protein [Solimonas flava]|uniref:hypothetical protein n=1 Tax=Solimonas flava TaxID=415849 RepID=UPI00040B34D3|nr:hypothetical protein [Solimonas flava]